jgi:hypothetical protein
MSRIKAIWVLEDRPPDLRTAVSANRINSKLLYVEGHFVPKDRPRFGKPGSSGTNTITSPVSCWLVAARVASQSAATQDTCDYDPFSGWQDLESSMDDQHPDEISPFADGLLF